jgi:hypothetical protein
MTAVKHACWYISWGHPPVCLGTFVFTVMDGSLSSFLLVCAAAIGLQQLRAVLVQSSGFSVLCVGRCAVIVRTASDNGQWIYITHCRPSCLW